MVHNRVSAATMPCAPTASAHTLAIRELCFVTFLFLAGVAQVAKLTTESVTAADDDNNVKTRLDVAVTSSDPNLSGSVVTKEISGNFFFTLVVKFHRFKDDLVGGID